jgi:subtilisin family serine protease
MKKKSLLLWLSLVISVTALGQTKTTNPSTVTGSKSSNIVTPERLVNDYEGGGVPVGEEGDLGFLVNRGPEVIEELCKRCEKKHCSLVVIIDSGVGQHAEFATSPKTVSTSASGNKQNISISDCRGRSCDETHGTQMAGIIASQQNGFGIIGINPTARIQSLDWNNYKDNPKAFAKKLEEIRIAERSNGLPIFVMATNWSLGSSVDNIEARDRNEMVQVLENHKYLFIVAAGQQDDPRLEGKDITYLHPEGPMNLGDQENVLVVSAYSNDQLLRFVNYSNTGLVHVAAAGEGIVTTTGTSGGSIKYGRSTGTSPATAIVAGIASTMLSKWPEYFKVPVDVKTRLQVISSPTLAVPHASRIAAGVLDSVALALRDPGKDLLRPLGDNPAYEELQTFRGWYVDRLKVLNEKNEVDKNVYIPTGDVYRICKKGSQWWVYTRVSKCVNSSLRSKCEGQIKMQGPYYLDIFEDLFSADNHTYKVGEITDLILRETNENQVPSFRP